MRRIQPVVQPALLNHLRSVPLFAAWPLRALTALTGDAHLMTVTAGETVISQSQAVPGLFAIVAGCIEVTSTQAAGRYFIRRFAEPGMMFGLASLVDGKGSPYTYMASARGTLLYVRREVILSVLARKPFLWESVARDLAEFHRVALSALDEQIFEPLSVRLARALVDMAGTQRALAGSGEPVRLRTTQEELAGLLAVSRQSVNKELRRLVEAKLVAVQYREIALLSPAGLRSWR